MWLKQQGLVAKVKDDCCIVITRNGAYKRVPVPAEGARVGMRIVYREPVFPVINKSLLLASSFLILCLALTLFHPGAPIQAAAYVSLDINPSLELAVDKNLTVTGVTFLNTDGCNLVRPDELKRKNLFAAVEEIVQRAITAHCIKPEQQNLIVSTVTVVTPGAVNIDPAALKQTVVNTVAAGGLSSDVKIYTVTSELRNTAETRGLSPGRYIIYKQLKSSGSQVNIGEVQQGNLRLLVNSHKIELLPDDQKISVKKHDDDQEPEVEQKNSGAPAPITAPGRSPGKHEGPDKKGDNEDESGKKKNGHEEQDLKRPATPGKEKEKHQGAPREGLKSLHTNSAMAGLSRGWPGDAEVVKN